MGAAVSKKSRSSADVSERRAKRRAQNLAEDSPAPRVARNGEPTRVHDSVKRRPRFVYASHRVKSPRAFVLVQAVPVTSPAVGRHLRRSRQLSLIPILRTAYVAPRRPGPDRTPLCEPHPRGTRRDSWSAYDIHDGINARPRRHAASRSREM